MGCALNKEGCACTKINNNYLQRSPQTPTLKAARSTLPGDNPTSFPKKHVHRGIMKNILINHNYTLLQLNIQTQKKDNNNYLLDFE